MPLLKDSYLMKYFNFQTLLPIGRLNGFENMIKLIQLQIDYQFSIKNRISTSILPITTIITNTSDHTMEDLNHHNIQIDNNLNHLFIDKDKDNLDIDIDHFEAMNDPRKNEIAVLLSGGVDSSVALQLLVQQGYLVRAYYLKIWLEDEIAHLNECPWEEDMSYAQSVCDMLNVTLGRVTFKQLISIYYIYIYMNNSLNLVYI